jgi:hypothetical protein
LSVYAPTIVYPIEVARLFNQPEMVKYMEKKLTATNIVKWLKYKNMSSIMSSIEEYGIELINGILRREIQGLETISFNDLIILIQAKEPVHYHEEVMQHVGEINEQLSEEQKMCFALQSTNDTFVTRMVSEFLYGNGLVEIKSPIVMYLIKYRHAYIPMYPSNDVRSVLQQQYTKVSYIDTYKALLELKEQQNVQLALRETPNTVCDDTSSGNPPLLFTKKQQSASSYVTTEVSKEAAEGEVDLTTISTKKRKENPTM